jgi:hypothetical protein
MPSEAAHFANAARSDRGQCWRMVTRKDGFQNGSPTGCDEPVAWSGAAQIGPKRYEVDSCDGHVGGPEKSRSNATPGMGPRSR